MSLFPVLLFFLRALFTQRLELAAENLALRQQLAILNRTAKLPKLRPQDRLLWTTLSRLWQDRRAALVVVKPDTVIKWHRQGFQLFWRWKSKVDLPGRPQISAEIRDLICRMSRENPLWGTPRIQAELHLLGFDVAASTVAKYQIKVTKPPSQTWKTFLHNHASQIVAIDFFCVPTAAFRNLYCFIILSHDRRQVVHFNVTDHPTAAWTAQQVVEAFPEDTVPRFLRRDRDQIFAEEFRRRVKAMQIEEVLTAPHSPWQNAYAERVIGSIRRECLDHVIVLSEEHLRRVLKEYFRYYNHTRPHQSLEKNSPMPRAIESRSARSSLSRKSADCITAISELLEAGPVESLGPRIVFTVLPQRTVFFDQPADPGEVHLLTLKRQVVAESELFKLQLTRHADQFEVAKSAS
jgi:putative transposase